MHEKNVIIFSFVPYFDYSVNEIKVFTLLGVEFYFKHEYKLKIINKYKRTNTRDMLLIKIPMKSVLNALGGDVRKFLRKNENKLLRQKTPSFFPLVPPDYRRKTRSYTSICIVNVLHLRPL